MGKPTVQSPAPGSRPHGSGSLLELEKTLGGPGLTSWPISRDLLMFSPDQRAHAQSLLNCRNAEIFTP